MAEEKTAMKIMLERQNASIMARVKAAQEALKSNKKEVSDGSKSKSRSTGADATSAE